MGSLYAPPEYYEKYGGGAKTAVCRPVGPIMREGDKCFQSSDCLGTRHFTDCPADQSPIDTLQNPAAPAAKSSGISFGLIALIAVALL
jgi:hypothetical protein